MDANTYEYQSYARVLRERKDLGRLDVQVRRGRSELRVLVAVRKTYRARRFPVCVYACPFVLPGAAPEQNNG